MQITHGFLYVADVRDPRCEGSFPRAAIFFGFFIFFFPFLFLIFLFVFLFLFFFPFSFYQLIIDFKFLVYTYSR